MVIYFLSGIVIIISIIGLLCNYFYSKGYRDCFKDQERNREFGKTIETFKATIIK